MFERILIANRGEIACRILTTAQSLGIHCTVIYSSADAESKAVRMADKAVWIGEAPSNESYLAIEKIIQVAKDNRIQAIHPGYGFLSENVAFAKACEKANICFIGPETEALRCMGSKQLAKQTLEHSGVPMTPGYHGDDQSEKTLAKEADTIGYPVLLKAAMGGGGKGMRAVHAKKDFNSALEAAKREALSSFGDDKIILEKLIERPRHIEVQIMADNHGNIVHLFERDCSIQRRHQKVIEEAPGLNIPEQTRQAMYKAAISVARTIDYRGAGTVEFLLGSDGAFYFMEMNTRLQVEHPVSEWITQQDFVYWQLLIASNAPLPLKQEEITQKGHAIECRIYAEDPDMDFMPSPGKLHYIASPQGEGVRVDSGVESGDHIPQYYDPMIAKLIVYGENRDIALLRLQKALQHYHIAGVKHNLGFLRSIIEEKDFRDYRFDTHYLESHALSSPQVDPLECLKYAVALHLYQLMQKTDPVAQSCFAWQNSLSSCWTLHCNIDDTHFTCQISPQKAQHCLLQWEDLCVAFSWSVHDNQIHLVEEGQRRSAFFHASEQGFTLFHPQGQANIEWIDNPYAPDSSGATVGKLTAPMPSAVVSILKQPGDAVQKGDALIILEAMKMEHTIHAPADGCVEAIFCQEGSQVDEGMQLISLSDPCMETA